MLLSRAWHRRSAASQFNQLRTGRPTPGAVLILGPGIGPVPAKAPGRVVYVVDEPRRRGFAYGTLPGHPESGEEAFVVAHHDDDAVSLTITAFSRPATCLAKIVGPLEGIAQRLKSRSACCCTDDEPSASHRSAARAAAS